MTLSIPPMEPLRREETEGMFGSARDRGLDRARAARRGPGGTGLFTRSEKKANTPRTVHRARLGGNLFYDSPAELEAEAVEGEVGERIHRRHDLRWGD